MWSVLRGATHLDKFKFSFPARHTSASPISHAVVREFERFLRVMAVDETAFHDEYKIVIIIVMVY